MRIVDLVDHTDLVEQTAAILLEQLGGEAWPDLEAAVEEVKESLEEGRVSRVALGEDRTVLGWVGAIPQYEGHAWEMHPLVVRSEIQRKGVGTALVRDVERLAAVNGVTTIWLGTDDEHGQTSLADVDLYPDPIQHLRSVENRGDHPFEFHLKMGYAFVGVIPDANGPGKPDILMAKRVVP